MVPIVSRRFPKFLAGALLVSGSLVFALALCEIALRVMGVEYKTFVVPDHDLGWALRPGGVGWYRAEGQAFVRINRAGFRGPDVPISKPAGTYRIAVLGDSFTVGLDVPDESLFETVLQQRLAANPAVKGKRVEVLNFGVGAYGTTQELLALRLRVLQYKPDLVLLMFFAGNDVSDNLRAVRQSLAESTPYLVRDEKSGTWVLDNSFRKENNWWLGLGATVVYHSRFLQIVNQVRKSWAARHTAPQAASTPPRIEGDPKDPLMQEAWVVTAEALGLIQKECTAAGVDLFAAAIPIPEAANPGSRVNHGATDLVAVDLKFDEVCKSKGIDHLLLYPQLVQFSNEHNQYLYGFPKVGMGVGHWNEHGHRVAGEALAAALAGRIANK